MSLVAHPQAIKIFFSYATTSAKDKRLFDKLAAHLSVLRRQHLIDEWYDSAISAGNDITQLIEAHLQAADIIVLLISADFVSSERCYEFEMRRALELRATGKAEIVPVILFPFDWQHLPIAKYPLLPTNGDAIGGGKRNVDSVLSEVAQGIRKIVEKLAGQIKKITHSSPQKSSLYLYPYRQNTFFTDRESTLQALSSFFSFTPTNQTRILTLSGLGGIGKTQIAQEYAYRTSKSYQTILWLNASSRESLGTQISALAEKLELTEKDRKDEEHLFTAIRRWLENQANWLLILDYLDDFTLIDLIVPIQSNGHVLVTTRIQAIGDITVTLSIMKMDTTNSVHFLLRRAGLLPIDADLDQATPAMIQQATEIAQVMDGLPLALNQAGAYLEETGCGLQTYYTLFEQERATLLRWRSRAANNRNHPDSVAITLTIGIEQVAQQRATNLDLLRLLAFLHPENIPYELLVDGARELNEPLRSLAAHPLTLNEALADLHSYSLIHYLADTTTLCIHRMIQAILIDELPKNQQRQWAGQAIRLVNSVFPVVSFATQEECKRYLAQAQHCATLIDKFRFTGKEGIHLLQRLGTYCYQQACYTEAETYLTQALRLQEKQRQTRSEEIAETLNMLGLLYYQQAHYQEAEKTHLRALAIREQLYGPMHSATAESLHNLATLYGSQGAYQQATEFYQRVLAFDEQTIGTEQPTTAKTLNNLAMILTLQGDYTQAKSLYQHALAIYERTASATHPDLTYPLNGLGDIAEKQGAYEQAEQFYQRALAVREQTLGDTHPDTASALNKLADIYEVQGKDKQAESIYQRALTICEQTLGLDHPDTALILNNLAFLADKQGDTQKAEAYYQRALATYERMLGPDHPTVADVLNNLGVLYQDMHKEEQAKLLLKRALALREKAFGEKHADTAQSLSNLADLLANQQEYQEAEFLFQRAFTLRLELFGPHHPDVTRTREKYISLLEKTNQKEKAQQLQQTNHIQTE